MKREEWIGVILQYLAGLLAVLLLIQDFVAHRSYWFIPFHIALIGMNIFFIWKIYQLRKRHD